MNNKAIHWLRLCLLCLALLLPMHALGEGGLSLRVRGDLRSYGKTTVTVSVPEAGKLTVRLSDGVNPLGILTRETPVEAGQTVLDWDGCGWYGEPLPEGGYSLSASLDTGIRVLTAKATFNLKRCSQALLYALPASNTLYLEEGNRWYAEVQLTHKGSVKMAVFAAGAPEEPLAVFNKNQYVTDKPVEFHWDGAVKGKRLAPGDYVLRFYAAKNPDRQIECPIRIAQGIRSLPPVAVTGPIFPGRNLNDQALWTLMQQPSVVADVQPKHHLDLREEPDPKARSLGWVHGRNQAMAVLELPGNGWARVGAWEHDAGLYIEGWVPVSQLYTVAPHPDYGLLVDLQACRMTVFYRGKRLGDLAVTIGQPNPKELWRKTAAGLFLTGDRVDGYTASGMHYDYEILFDGGNLFHQIGYSYTRGKKDFSQQSATLGMAASHGCLRLPADGTDGFNAWWIYSHIPVGTRVVILPAE